MKTTNISELLDKIGMPKNWQIYVVLHALFALSLVFIGNQFLFNASNILLTSLVSFGVIMGLKRHKHDSNPWKIFVVGINLLGIYVVLQSLKNIDIGSQIVAMVEQLGITLISLFSIFYMLYLEKKHKFNGLTIDVGLIIFSILFSIFLLSPNLLNSFLYHTNFIQQLNIINLFFAIVFLFIALLNQFLFKKLPVKDLVRITMTLALIVHFFLETTIDSQKVESYALLSRLSWAAYHLSGSLAITFIFLERFSYDHHVRSNGHLSSQLMWSASIMAIIVIPLGIIIRNRLGYPPIDSLIIGTASFFLSSVVIWRFQVLMKNTDQQKNKLRALAYIDPLTNLPNYHGYLEKLSKINMSNILILSINVEDFKSINDLHGRDFGDQVLVSLSNRLRKTPGLILVSRTGADYFHAVFRTPEKNISNLVIKVQQYLGVWDTVQSRRITVPLTYGASHSVNNIKPEILVRQAEQALKRSRTDHTCFTLYTEQRKQDSKRINLPRHELREILQKAVDDNYLPIHFQPIYDLRSGALKAVELLIRVESEKHGLLLPGQFLDQAKSYGLLTSLTRVCVNMIAKCYQQLPDVIVNINVPPYMLNNPQLLNEFIRYFEDADLPIERFCVEVTEDGDIPTDHLIPSITLLKAHGFKIAMDDFGTGYSSLSRLSVLPVDVVKIDRSLLLAASAGNKAILESAINLMKRLGVSAVVEGVETIEQLNLIKQLGADSVQGFLLSKPVRINKASLLALNASDIVAEF